MVASPSAAAVARSLGFRTVYALRPGQSLALLGGALTIRATAGALVGPPWSQRELGLVLQENLEGGARGASLYYEPHAGGRAGAHACVRACMQEGSTGVARHAQGRRACTPLRCLPGPGGKCCTLRGAASTGRGSAGCTPPEQGQQPPAAHLHLRCPLLVSNACCNPAPTRADYLPESVATVAPVDVVVSPPCSQILFGYPLVGARRPSGRGGGSAWLRQALLLFRGAMRRACAWLTDQSATALCPPIARARLPHRPPQVKGSTDTLSLLKLLTPKVFVPLNNAEFDQEGPLADLLVEEGSAAQIQQQLAAEPSLAGVRVCVPTAAQPMPVEL